MSVNERLWTVFLAMVLTGVTALLGFAPMAWAQDEADNPPEILTSELALKTLLESDRLEVNFVIVDTDQVTEVKINGQAQAIEPGDTVMLTRTFDFTQDVTRVEVSAKDEHGHTRTVTYTVYRPGVDPDKVAPEPAKAKLQWAANYDARYEEDTNPSNDLSSPISISGVDVVGVVPDSEQSDSRLNVTANGAISYGIWSGFAGLSAIEYSKADNDQFKVRAWFLGGGVALPVGERNAIVATYVFTDINLGGYDYAQTHTVSPGFRWTGQDPDGDSTRRVVALDVTRKQFARSDLQTDATVLALKTEYNSLDKAKQDSYRSVYALGSASEGIDVTEFNYLSGDWDWRMRWDSGLLFDVGTGVQYRDYANDTPLSTDTFLGNTRVDIPARFSTGIGYQFLPQIRTMFNYRYTFNLSNKTPYVRQIYGISVNGAF